jgi:hypothetical protein
VSYLVAGPEVYNYVEGTVKEWHGPYIGLNQYTSDGVVAHPFGSLAQEVSVYVYPGNGSGSKQLGQGWQSNAAATSHQQHFLF